MKQNVPCAARGLAVQLVCIGVEEVREAREGLALQTLLLGVRSLAHAVMDGHARCSRFAPPFSAQLGAPGGWPA